MVTIINDINELILHLIYMKAFMENNNIGEVIIQFEGYVDDGEVCYTINSVQLDKVEYFNSEDEEFEVAIEEVITEDPEKLLGEIYTPLWDTNGSDETITYNLRELCKMVNLELRN